MDGVTDCEHAFILGMVSLMIDRLIIFLILLTLNFIAASQQAVYNKDHSLLIPMNSEGDLQNQLIYDDREEPFKYWRQSIAGIEKNRLKLDSNVLELDCSDCIESYAGMLQFKLFNDKGEKFRGTLHLEMKANLFRFQMMHELGYILPAQSYQPLLKVFFNNKAHKDHFKFSLKSHIGLANGADWKQFIEDEGDNWILLKSVMVESDWSDKLAGYHWLNIYNQEVTKEKYIKRLFPLFLLTDWGENLEVDVKQFLRRKGSGVLIKHPLNDFFKDVSIRDLQWMAYNIIKLDNAAIQRAIKAMGLKTERRAIVSSKIYALINYFKEVFFTKEQREKFNFPKRPTKFIVDKKIKLATIKENWRYYIMLGLDRLVQTGLRETSRLLRLNWEEELLKIGNEGRDEIGDFFDQESDRVVLPLKVSSFANIGLNTRFSRDLVRGQYYGNTHLANIADTLRYGGNTSLGLNVDILSRIPLSFFQRAQIEYEDIYLRPVDSQKTAYKKFFKDKPIPLLLKKWKRKFRKSKCQYIDEQNDCSQLIETLDYFSQELKLDETLILSKNYSFPRGFRLRAPDVNILYGLNPFEDSRVSWEKGTVNLDRVSIVRTETGVKVIKTESKNKFKRWIANLNFFIPFFSWTSRHDEEKPITKIFELDFTFFDKEKKVNAFLALKEVLLHRKTGYLEKNFSFEELNSNLLIYRDRRPVWGTDLIARKKDKVEIDNELFVQNFKYDVELNKHSPQNKRHLVLFKKVSRKFWDWIGAIEDTINAFTPFNLNLRLRTIRDGEFAGNLRRNAQVNVLTTEGDLTDESKGFYEPIMVVKHKKINFRIKAKRIFKEVDELKKEFKNHFEKIDFPSIKPNLEKSRGFEVTKTLVFKSKLVKKIVASLTNGTWESFLPKHNKLNRKLTRFFKKHNKTQLSIREKLGLAQLAFGVLIDKFSVAQLIDHFKKDHNDNIIYDLQIRGVMFYEGEKLSRELLDNLNPEIYRHESILARLLKDLGISDFEINGSLRNLE